MFKYEKKAQKLRERIEKLPRVHLAHLPTPLEETPPTFGSSEASPDLL